MSKPKGRRRQVRKDKETARKVSELLNRTRSPDPGRQCPCGYPRQVVRMSRLPKGSRPVPAGWLPVIMPAGSRQCPRAVDRRRPAREPVHAGGSWFQVRHGLPVNHK